MKTCVLFSGGLDSYITYRHARYIGEDYSLLRISLQHSYNEKECLAIADLGLAKEVVSIDVPILRQGFNNVPDGVQYEIPGRNLLLAVIGMMTGASKIWMSFQNGEMSYRAKDKNATFLNLVSGLGSFVFHDHQGDIKVESPLSAYGKVEALNYALNTLGVTPDEVRLTSSCLSPVVSGEGDTKHYENCGACKACVRRAGVLRQFGINEHYHTEPFESALGKAEIMRCREGYYDKERSRELLGALK